MQETKTTKALALIIGAGVLIAAILAFSGAFGVSHAYANRQLSSPVQVSDDITRLHVNKLDKDTHEHVLGASMAIIERDTGIVVDEWVTDGTTHEIEKGLDVNVVYILREMSAPAGYALADDTEFIVNETEGTGITVLSGDSVEQTDSYKVAVYDVPDDTSVVTTVYKDREISREVPGPGESKEVAPKTGDETPLWLVGVLVCCAAAAAVVLQIVKRRIAKR